MKRALLAGGAILAALLVLQAALVLGASPVDPVREEPLLPDAATAPTDAHLALARELAPWIYHETDSERGRMDIPTAMDFDGDLDALDNWEEMPRHALLPTVYYTVAESETHWFVTYHLYHPRDWSRLVLGIQDTHEGDGENLQVVAQKGTNSVVLLTTQAHYDAWSYAPLGGNITSGEETLRSDVELVGGHPVVYVTSGGHAIYGSHDPRAANRLSHRGEPVVTYRPANPWENVTEPVPPWNESPSYRLVSLPAFLANETAPATLLTAPDGRSPRYHLGDRYSGPLGNSRGISPFALGYGWSDDEFDALFWDPAATYAEKLAIRGNWSTELLRAPFAG